MEGLGINLGYLLVQIFNFLIILVILIGWMYRPILDMLDKRRKTIAQGLEDARVAAEARASAEKEADAILAKAREESSKLIREATERAEKAGMEIKAAAEQEVEAARKSALGEAEKAKDEALGELRGQVAALAIAAAQKVIGEALDEHRQHALIEEFFSGLKDDKVVVLQGEGVAGASAEVTSALPLTDAEQEIVRRDIVEKLGSDAAISFRVDPKILGGLIVRVGDKVIDGSVSGKLIGLHQAMR